MNLIEKLSNKELKELILDASTESKKLIKNLCFQLYEDQNNLLIGECIAILAKELLTRTERKQCKCLGKCHANPYKCDKTRATKEIEGKPEE